MSAFNTMGKRLGKHAGTYSLGSALGVFVGMFSVGVVTRFLPPSEYGVYALYVGLASALGMIYGLIVFKGSVRTIFGGDDDDEGDEDDEDEQEDLIAEGQARRALGTALTLTAMLSIAGTAIVALVPQAAAALIGQGHQPEDLIIIAAIAGGLGAIWRLSSTVLRRERRSTLFVMVQTSRPLLALAATIPLVIADGIHGAVLGLMVGNAAALVFSLFTIRHSWTPAFDIAFVRMIGQRGGTYLPLVLSFWAIQEGNIFLLSHFAPASEVGFFRVANQVASFGGFIVVAFLRASGPLSREPIHKAARRERGAAAVDTLMCTYFALGTVYVMLIFILAADVLVKIAPPSYAAAAPLIPVLVLAGVANGWFRVTYRYSRFPEKRRAKIRFSVLAGVIFFAVGILLVPRIGAYGIAWATTAAFGGAALGLHVMAMVKGTPLTLAHRRVAVGLLLAVGCYAAAKALEDLVGVPPEVTAFLALVAYPALLIGTTAIPRTHVRPLASIARAALPLPEQASNLKLEKLDKRQRRVLRMVVRDGRTFDDIAVKLRTSDEDVEVTFMAGLRRLGGLGKPAKTDADVAPYLLSTAAIADRDAMWKRLASDGADPAETDTLATILKQLRRTPRDAWKVNA
ncbi:MAG: hypothetical protein QOG62_1720 [Thermoleophilaceae bacterium]|nr:hypothetical protein [Thermoleophilaceae bacterium]